MQLPYGFEGLIKKMSTNTVDNYVIPGLSSSLLENGKVRLFECTRHHREQIVPHSHRFDFYCLVLEGEVMNHMWREDEGGDEFHVSTIRYKGGIGKHDTVNARLAKYKMHTNRYGPSEWYGMTHEAIHSITFSKGAKVLFFEGPQVTDKSVVLEPYVNEERIPTFKVESWMFKRGDK